MASGVERTRAAAIAIFAACALLLWRLSLLFLRKAYAIDEFHYAHEAWVVAAIEGGFGQHVRSGQPFALAMLLSPLIPLAGGDPAKMILLRYAMIAAGAVVLASIAALAARSAAGSGKDRAIAAGLALVFVLANRAFAWRIVEIRPDCVALALVFAAALVMPLGRRAEIMAGALVAVACFVSMKAVVYGSAFAVPFVLGRRLGLLAGFAGGAGLFAAIHAAAGDFVGTLSRAAALIEFHEEYYPRITLSVFFWPYVRETWWLTLLALLGWGEALRGIRRSPLDQLLVPLFVTAWASYLLQKAAYPYSLLPIAAMQALFAARGVSLLLARFELSAAVAAVAGATWLAFDASRSLDGILTNDRQIEVQEEIGRLTDPDDTVFSMTSSYVFRPRAFHMDFIDKARTQRWYGEIVEEVPRVIRARDTMLFVTDARFVNDYGRSPLAEFIGTHFQRYNDDLYVWGTRWTGTSSAGASFEANTGGRYFVHPPDALSRGELSIGGAPVREPILTLEEGAHRVEWRPGPSPPERVYLIWLPRNGERFDPEAPSPPLYLAKYILP